MHMTRIATVDQTVPPFIVSFTAGHLPPEQQAEYTFLLVEVPGEEDQLITESHAREVEPNVEHLAVGDVYYFLGT